MDKLHELFEELLNKELTGVILSNSRDVAWGSKIKVRPVLIKDELLFQETLYKGTQVFHTNYEKKEMAERLSKLLRDIFCQAQITAMSESATVLVSKKGTVTIKRKKKSVTNVPNMQERSLDHNRTKQYILQEGEPVDFLVGLGVQTPDGRIAKAKFDKFRQINRYLEFIEDILDKLPTDRTISIIDFGCGKSYLTFAMYYYLHDKQGRDIQVTGLDLKMDVIRYCNELAEKLHYDNLRFEQGDISSFEGADKVDMVVTLHACDKATDYALEKAVKWGASVIMAVPCCQHELNGQLHSDILQPVFKYGVIKERMAALLTDALRANLLEQRGYDTQILEFIDMEHTPKNLMIRAVKGTGMRPVRTAAALERTMEFLKVDPTLKNLL